jgi:DNA recombination protein RmuC
VAQDAPRAGEEAPILWATFGGAAMVFIVVFVFVLRSRIGARGVNARATAAKSVANSKKAPRKKSEPKRSRTEPSDFFQPAGDGAEITFDEGPSVAVKKPVREGKTAPPPAETGDEAEVIIERKSVMADPPLSATPSPPPALADAAARRASPFAGLFAKKKREEAEAAKEAAELDGAPGLLSRASPFSKPSASVFAKPYSDEGDDQDDWETPAEPLEDESRRALEEEEKLRAEEDRRRAQERRAAAEREAEFERRKQAAFAQRQQEIEDRERAMAARSSSFEAQELRRDLSYELDERFQALADRFEARLRSRDMEPSVMAADDAARALSALAREIDDRFVALSERLESRIASVRAPANDEVTELSMRMAEHRGAMDAAIAAMANRIDDVTASAAEMRTLRSEMASLKRAVAERGSGPSAPLVQLSDIVRNALPPNTYELRASLSNNRRADCIIRLTNAPGPIAVDARFPIEAFARLHEASEGQERAENEFRRTALRHVVDVAERLIIPGETAESALMFVPSESMYSELHARFPDVIQDSYRARVWIVSPTTLTATLHTIRAVLRDARKTTTRQPEPQQVLADVNSLRRRVGVIEDNFVKPRSVSPDQPYQRPDGNAAARRPAADGPPAPQKPPAVRDELEQAPPPAAAPSTDKGEDGDLWEDDSSGEEPRTPFPLR